MRPIALIGSAVVILAATQATAQTAPSPDSVYAGLLGRLRSGDTTIDFQAFRLAFARSTAYDPMSTARAALRQRLNAALIAADMKTAALRADSLLSANYTDINAHVIRARVARQADDSAQARHHGAVARGLVRSLDLEHRGSATNPILLIDPDEENVYGLVTGLERTSKYTTASCGSRICDSTVFHDSRSRRDTTIVFDVTLIAQKSFGRMP